MVKLSFEVYCRKSARKMGFVRLRNKHIIASCPNAEQAELVMDAVARVVQSMHGKLLVKSE